ncbi:hypothetical protein BKA81DRAFT_380305 [Phyllosticta paracitricarpa]|uniref:DUF4189 domain-containing protein n=1 Tax=Phyllosticta paracitricarpa TaxID=2016321 RepID=A0ABR1N0K6_9PEZI
MKNIVVTLLALAVAPVLGSAIPQGPNEIERPQREEGGNSNFCTGVIGHSKVVIAGKGTAPEYKLDPKYRLQITKEMVSDAVTACRNNLGSGCAMIICNIDSRQPSNNPCGSSSHPPTLKNVDPDQNHGDREFFDPKCAI